MKAVWREFAKSLRGRRNRFVSIVAWLGRDAMAQFGWRIPATLLLSIIGLVLNVAALGTIAVYAQHLESGDVLRLPGFLGVSAGSLAPRDPQILLGAAVVAVAAIAFGALCRYAAEARLLRIAARYEAYCARRAVAVTSRLPMWVSQVHEWRLNKSFVAALAGADSRVCARALRIMAEGLVAPVALAGLFGVLAWLDWRLTVELIVVGLVLSPLVLGRVIRAAELTRVDEGARDQMRKEQSVLHTSLANGTAPANERHSFYSEILGRGEVGRGIERFAERFVVLRQTALMTFIIFGAMLFVMVVHGGGQALAGEQTWTEFIFYMLVMRVNLGYLVGMTSAAALIGRFYPSIDRHFSLVDTQQKLNLHDGLETRGQGHAPVGTVTGRRVDDSLPALAIKAGTRLGIITDAPVDRFIVGTLARHVAPSATGDLERLLGRANIISGNAVFESNGLRDIFGLGDALTCEELREELRRVGCDESAGFLKGKHLDTPLTAAQIRQRPVCFDVTLQVIAAVRSPHSAVVCNHLALRLLPATLSELLFGCFLDRVCLIVYPLHVAVDQLPRWRETGLVVLRGDTLHWQIPDAVIRENENRIRQTLARLQAQVGRRVRGNGNEDSSTADEE